jgi:hypothetical protein
LRYRFADFWWGDRGLSAFLLFLFAGLFLAPFFESRLLGSLTAIFLSLLLISGVAYISPRTLLRRAAGAVALIAIVLHWLQEFQPNRGLDIASSLVSLLCLATLTLVVLIRVFRDTGSVTSARVQGAVAAYVLFGVTWSILYRLLDLCLPAAFSIAAATAMTAAEQRESFAYFSFVTLTTLGYGDITAVHPIARMFVIFEALIGQLYPATLLARLVSLEISHRQERNQSSAGAEARGGADPPKQPACIVTGGEP